MGLLTPFSRRQSALQLACNKQAEHMATTTCTEFNHILSKPQHMFFCFAE